MDGEQKTEFLECERNRVFDLLMISSGLLGAFTYSIRGGVFCNAQTGNVVLISMALGNGDWKGAAYFLIPITAYALGAAAAEILPDLVKKTGLRWNTLLVGFEVLVTMLLGFLPESAPYHISQVAINFICSMQFNTFRKAEGIPMATTFCTNHVCQAGISLAKWLQKRDFVYLKKCRRHVEMLLMFIAGAITGTVLCGLFSGKAIFSGSFLLFIVFMDLLHADLTKEKYQGGDYKDMKLPVKNRVVHELFKGKGDALICDIASEDIMNHKNRCFITIQLSQGASLGMHRHVHESEIYYVIQGHGWYMDNEQEYEIKTGEAVICLDGDSHGIINKEKEELVFVALVIHS